MRRASHPFRLLPFGIFLFLALIVLFGITQHTPLTGTAYDQSLFPKRQILCDAPLTGPEHTVTGDFNSQFCVQLRGISYPFVIDGSSGRSIRLLLYHDPYRLFLFQEGTARLIDLDGDGEGDVEMTLMGLDRGAVTMRIRFIGQAPISSGEEELSLPSSTQTPSSVDGTAKIVQLEEPAPFSNNSYLLFGIICIGIVLLIVTLVLVQHHYGKQKDEA